MTAIPMKLPRRPLIRWGLAALALLLVLLGARSWLSGEERPQLVTAPVTVGDVERSVLATGTLESANMVSVGAQVSGQVKALRVELGQQVRQGDLIAEIDSVPQRNALANAEANLNNVRAQRRAQEAALNQARLAFRRQKEMLAGDATSRAEYEAAEAAARTAEAQVAALDAQIAQAETAVNTARVNVGYTQITAPMDGTIVAIVTRQGQTVNANQTAPTIVKLARLDAMVVKAQISEADVIKVQGGQEVYFTVLGDPDRRFRATLRSVEPAPESIKTESNAASSSSAASAAVYYNGLFDVPNPDGQLRISMTAQVTVVLARAKGVPTIPAAALGQRGRDGIYKVQVQAEDGSVSEREAKVGLNNNAVAEIVSGLQPGERVVIGQAAPGGEAAGGPPAGQRRGPRSPLGF